MAGFTEKHGVFPSRVPIKPAAQTPSPVWSSSSRAHSRHAATALPPASIARSTREKSGIVSSSTAAGVHAGPESCAQLERASNMRKTSVAIATPVTPVGLPKASQSVMVKGTGGKGGA